MQGLTNDDLLLLFIVQSSETILRRGHREAGGAGAGSSSFLVRAGEDFEVVVQIKTTLGPVTGPSLEHMMREIDLLPEGVLKKTGEPRMSAEPGMACFPVRMEQAGVFEVCAAVKCKGASHTIGRQTRVKVAPGAMRFGRLDAKESAEVGEQVELVLQTSDTDVFGNTIGSPLSESAKVDLAAQSLHGVWVHEDEGKEWPLTLTQPAITERGLVVAAPQLLFAGRHTFRIQSCGQELATTVEISPGAPHSVHLIGEGKAQVLQQRRWCCKVEVRNRHGYGASFSGREVSMELVPSGSRGGGCYPLQVVELAACESAMQGCSLSEGTSETMVWVLEVFLAETDDAASAGSYHLRAKRTSDDGELSCEPSTVYLDLPLDPAAWTGRDLAESLRLDGLLADAESEVLKDEFDTEISGKDLIQRGPSTAWGRLKDGLFLGRRFANQQAKDDEETRIQTFAAKVFERHTLAGLGKGKYQSAVAKCISEADLGLAPNAFDTGGYSEIFMGYHEGRAVAIKIPLIKNRGLQVSEHTAEMMKEVEREIKVTKSCRHQHVVEVIGLMVGPGRIGIVMELCDTSLAKRIQATGRDVNWAESVRLLMDGACGLAFIHQQKRTTHGDLKPDNLLIQQGRLKVADFGLATVRRTITNLTGEVSRKGTTFFMAPEKMIGGVDKDLQSTDVWSFGCAKRSEKGETVGDARVRVGV